VLLHDVVLVALCRGWLETLPLAGLGKLPEVIDADEPVTAWLFASKADAALMAKYVVRYPRQLLAGLFQGAAIWNRGNAQTTSNRSGMSEAFFATVQKVTRPILGLPSPNCSHHRCAPSRHLALGFQTRRELPEKAVASFVSSGLMCLPMPASPLNSHHARYC
jgi:hypothetical protein